MKYLEHEFLEGDTFGPDGDYTDLKCEICGLKVYLNNYSNHIMHDDLDGIFHFLQSDIDINILDSYILNISCSECQIKKLLE